MSLSLIWDSQLRFHSGLEGPALNLDSDDPAVMSPMQALSYAVMGCMAMDVVHILEKGRHDLKGLTVDFSGERATDYPKRFTKIHLTFTVAGNVPKDAVERAIQLSHDKYCSVSNSLAKDIAFTTSVEVQLGS